MNAPAKLALSNRGLEAEGLRKVIRRRPVVQDVSLTLQRGEVVGLLGPNGAGKTTCFYLLVGLVQADRGKMTLDGVDISRAPMFQRARLGMGYLPQEPSVFRGLTVAQNIDAILEISEQDPLQRRSLREDLLAEFQLDHLAGSLGSELSGGERRRVEIARALAAFPQFLLLDEPFAGVDPIAVGELRQLVQRVRLRNIGILVTDHNVGITLGMVDRAYILHEGRVLIEGPPAMIAGDSDVRRVYLGEGFRF